jgi:spore germination cell wall hydrolase CwlJ-like protein
MQQFDAGAGLQAFCGAQVGRRSERGRSERYRPPPTNRIVMIGTFRTGRWAAALSAIIALFTTPGQAAAHSGERVQQTFAAAPVPAAVPAVAYTTVTTDPAQPVATDPAQPVAGAAAVAAPVQRTLKEMVDQFVDAGNQEEERLCLAKAVYFEARGESLEGQLAVAEVVLNRAASGRYPTTVCGVVTQPAQFSFIRRGKFPAVRMNVDCWRKALAIADIARNKLANEVPSNVLWYHANYVAPAWGRWHVRVAQIGAHIFYG